MIQEANTMEETKELQDSRLVLMGESAQENTLRFYAKQEEVLRLAKGRFYYRGELVEDKYQVYERFNEWLTQAEEDSNTPRWSSRWDQMR